MKAIVEVTQRIEVELDESRFTPEMMADFRAVFYPFHTLDDHIEHIAQLKARGIIGELNRSQFVEGYGPLDQAGIRVRDLDDVEIEIIEGGEVAA